LCCTLSLVSKNRIYIVCHLEHVVLAFFSQGDKFICLLEVLSFSLGAILEYPCLITMVTLFRNPISFHSRGSVQISPLFIFGDASGMWATLPCTLVHVQILNQNCA
jgi:hypothetical protein